jgi:hypothetical protein
MEIELVLDDIERLIKNIRTFTSVLKDMQKAVDEMESIKPKKEKKKKFPKPEPLELTEPLPEPLPESLSELKPVEEVEALECEPPKKSKKIRKPKLERS